jgi:hypothetical protein
MQHDVAVVGLYGGADRLDDLFDLGSHRILPVVGRRHDGARG